MNSRYRRALSNNCTEGTLLKYSPRRQKCPSQAPRGLQLFTSEGTLVATLEKNVTFLVFLEEVLTSLNKATVVQYTATLVVCTLFFCCVVICISRCWQRRSTDAGAPYQINMQWHDLALDLVLVDIIESALLCDKRPRLQCDWQHCFLFCLFFEGSQLHDKCDGGLWRRDRHIVR